MQIWTQDSNGIYIDNNMLDSQRQCQEKCYNNYTLGLSLGEHTPATYFGTRWHEAMHELWGRWLPSGELDSSWAIDKAWLFIQDYDLAYESEKKGKTFTRLKNAILEYGGFTDEITGVTYADFHHNHKTLIAEEFVSHPICEHEGKTVYYCGQIDRVLWDVEGKKAIALDYKTSSWNQLMDNVWAHSPQFIGYLWLINKKFGSEIGHTNSFILDLFQMQAKFKNKFTRRQMYFDDWMIDEWEAKRIKEIHRLLSAEPPFEDAPKCTDYGGCPYFRLCSQPPEFRANLETHLFKRIVWNIHGNLPVDTEGMNSFLKERQK